MLEGLAAPCKFCGLDSAVADDFCLSESAMVQAKLIGIISIVLASVAIAYVSFRWGLRAQQTEENHSVAYAQATLAFGHYKFYERIESLLLRKCYEAALTEAMELKNLQLVLLSDSLRATENDSELVEYIKIRDPKLLETALAGVPERKPYTTTCP